MILKQLGRNCFKVTTCDSTLAQGFHLSPWRGKKTYYFSYETCVAYEDEFNAVRLDKKLSATTSRHLGKMGVKDFTPLPEDYFLTLTS